MNELLIYLVSGLALAGSFALVGSGIVVIYRVTHVLNFAQGTFAVFGALISYSLSALLPPPLGAALAVVVCTVIGVGVGFAAIGRRGTPPMISLLVTLGMSMISAAVIIAVWGQTPVSPPGVEGTVVILGVELEAQRLVVLVVALVTFAFLGIFFSATDLGRGLSAAASNPRAARLVGIDTRAMGLFAFGLAGALGGLAGAVIAPTNALTVSSDLPLMLSGLAAAIFGGLRSPWMTFLGAVILGVGGQLVAGYLGGSYQTQIALVMMLTIMVVRARSLNAEEAK